MGTCQHWGCIQTDRIESPSLRDSIWFALAWPRYASVHRLVRYVPNPPFDHVATNRKIERYHRTMATLASGFRACGVICLILNAGCAGSGDTKIIPGGGGQGKTSGAPPSVGGSHAGGSSGSSFVVPITTDVLEGLLKSCGNSKADNDHEQCDDGNTEGGDGCTKTCQLERDWSCPRVGPCTNNAVCGDGKLSRSEACDDGNTKDGDGCSSDCKTRAEGWECRAPNTDCFPVCGDGRRMLDAEGQPAEGCDDGNTDNGDGCSSSCMVEPGATCVGEPSQCAMAVCGNGGDPEAGESCDAGSQNGLFYGDGKGCSKTCTREPTCRDGQGVTRACTTTCGDGNIDEDQGEECDDGNGLSNDGCSKGCKTEKGFVCDTKKLQDTSPCKDGSGDCLVLPITYRDFDGQNSPNGHPDFFYMGATPKGGKKTICVPNASGRAQGTSGSCPGNDSTPLCLGLVKNTLGSDGKPEANSGRAGGLSCPCQFTDWDKTSVTSGLTTGSGVTVTTCGSGATQNVPLVKVDAVPIFQSADTFKEWYADGDRSVKVVSTLELAQIDGSNQYQFSSSGGRSVYRDIHDIFLRQGKSVTGLDIPKDAVSTLSSGFFPLDEEDATKSQTKVCNLWPYWSAPASCVAQQWDARGWSGAQSTEPTDPPGVMVPSVEGIKRDFYFTSEARYLFRYTEGESLAFFGDDDVWVFINGHLVLDLGAPHERLQGSVTLSGEGKDSAASATISAQDVKTEKFTKVGNSRVSDLGLEKGKTYEIAVFHADVHPRESNYQLTLFGFDTYKSVCTPDCGDGVKTMGEQCDNGRDKNADDAYGGCTTRCEFGPYCGDEDINGPEECDHGANNGDLYGKDGCTSDCKVPPYCGDGITDGEQGEECDTKGDSTTCDSECKVRAISI